MSFSIAAIRCAPSASGRMLNAVDIFDERFGQTERSKVLRIGALIAKGHIPEAEEAVSKLSSGDPNGLRLGISLTRAKAAQLRNALRQAQEGFQFVLLLSQLGQLLIANRFAQSGNRLKAPVLDAPAVGVLAVHRRGKITGANVAC